MTGDRPTTSPTDHAGFRSTPMAAVAREVLSRLANLAKATMQTEARLAKHSVDLTWATLAGDLDRACANKACIESMAREGARYWIAMGELGIRCATDLVAIGKSLSTTVLREVSAAGRKARTRQASGALDRP